MKLAMRNNGHKWAQGTFLLYAIKILFHQDDNKALVAQKGWEVSIL